MLTGEAHRRRRWAFGALILGLVGGLAAGVVACSAPPPPAHFRRANHAPSARELQADARGIVTCSALGVSSTPAWGPPTRGAPGITALAKRDFSLTSLRLVEQHLPSNCASADYWAPRGRRMILVVQFPLQLTRHDRDLLARGDLTYLRRTGAVVSVRYTASPVACSKSGRRGSPLCWAGLPPGSSSG